MMAPPTQPPVVVALGDPPSLEHSLVGGKGANLGRMVSAGLPVPPGFVLTTAAYRKFIAENGSIRREIDAVLRELDVSDVARLEEKTATIRRVIEEAPLPAELEGIVTDLYLDLNRRGHEYVAVRSSATAEDLADASFAGLHDTFLDVRGLTDVVDMVRRCWASLWTSRCTSYREQNKISHADVAIAVVVQAMVDAEVAGVMFTANPVTGTTSEIVVNSSYGLGEGVVSGILEPDEFIVTRKEGKIRRRHLGAKEVEVVRNPNGGGGGGGGGESTVEVKVSDERRKRHSINDEQLRRLIAMSTRIEAQYGGLPQDIEWAWSRGEPYLLQTRPITGVRLSWDEDVDAWQTRRAPEDTVWSNKWAQAYWTGAITPLYYSIRAKGIRNLDDDNFRLWGRPDLLGAQRYMYRHGTMYYNLGVYGEIMQMLLPKALRGKSAELYPPSMRAANLALKPFRLFSAIRLHLRTWFLSKGKHGPLAFLLSCKAWMEKWKYNYRNPPASALREMPDGQLWIAAREAQENFTDFNQYPRTGFWVYSPIAFGLLQTMLDRWYRGPNENCFEELLSGLPERSAQVEESIALWKLGRRIASSATLTEALERSEGADFFERCRDSCGEDGKRFLADYEGFLAEWGHRGHADRDMWYPRRSEDAEIDVRSFRLLTQAQTSPEVVEERLTKRRVQVTQDVEGQVGRGLFGGVRLRLFRAIHRYCLRFLVLRDDQRDQNDRNSMRKKRVFLEVGRRAFERGLVDEPNDFFFLSEDELWELLGDGGRTKITGAKIAGRKANFMDMHTRVASPELYLRGNQNVVEIPEEDSEGGGDGDDADVIRGAVLSRGVVEGRVRVVRSLSEIDSLKNGDILVCNGTDPGWAPVFNVIGGLIMETGGMLAHGACLSREFGLPAVTIAGAISKFADAEYVKLDATTGQVRILRQSGQKAEPDSRDPESVVADGPSTRVAKVDGLINARDMGGLTTRDGRRTRRGVLYRSDHPDLLSAEGATTLLRDMRVSTIIDLRTKEEAAAAAKKGNWRSPSDLPAVKVINLPIDDGWHGTIPEDAQERRNILTSKYLGYLEQSSDNIVEAIRTVSKTQKQGNATLVHCAAGKDRTGVICAFIAEVLGVKRELVVDDYVMTAPNMERIMARLADNPLFIKRKAINPPEVYQVLRHTMEGLLSVVDEKHGGVEKWLLGHGMTLAEIDGLRALLLDDCGR